MHGHAKMLTKLIDWIKHCQMFPEINWIVIVQLTWVVIVLTYIMSNHYSPLEVSWIEQNSTSSNRAIRILILQENLLTQNLLKKCVLNDLLGPCYIVKEREVPGVDIHRTLKQHTNLSVPFFVSGTILVFMVKMFFSEKTDYLARHTIGSLVI